ncbi:tyrosine-type recombinase/integrase [Sphingomonas turrisvirgatae]|uniref:Integrase n=1 Tax=Sphingomonas turrisvirgatae TaxID=1888892 RepID=A0A1E3LTL7_9SPHN|nr:site-specific integrase [Sphingomonas turrisvirgatae]ODP37108.1 integrase [Sphingomonas turrisvirgatae]
MRVRNKLNVKQIATLTKVGVHSDGGGLYLRVRTTGSRSWLFVYTLHGKRREMGLGSDLDVSLAKAREKAAEARAMVLEGQDPQAERLRAKVAAQPVLTFGKFAIDWLDAIESGFANAKHRQQWRNTLTTYAAPLFPLPITDVTTAAVLEVLKPIWLTKAETASRVRGRIERVLDAAKVKGLRTGENPARGKGHLDLLLPKRPKTEVKHHAALPFREMADFMVELRKRPAMAARALEFTILTAARSGETRGMTWDEVDLEARLWTVPGTRMKAGQTHQVPLSDGAVAILEAVKPAKVKPETLVFPAQRGGAMSDMALSQLLKRMNRGDITVHGFRSTFRDWAGELTQFGREEIEMALAHTIESAVERAYRRGRAVDKRRELMSDWGRYCVERVESGRAPQAGEREAD